MTAPNPILQGLERDWKAAKHTVTEAAGWFDRHDGTSQTPAPAPATMAAATAAATAPQEDTMSLAQLEDDVKTDLTDGIQWLQGFAQRIGQAAPGIIATSEAVGSSTVGALVEAVDGRILPPQLETVLAGIVKDFVDKYATPQVTVPAAPQPAQ